MISTIKAARLLGWTSLLVGATEIAATRWLEEELGIDDHHTLIRAFGAREIATGATILAQPGLNRTLAAGLWGRVAGDILDLAMLAAAGPTTRNPSGFSRITSIVVGVTGLDFVAASLTQRALHRARNVSRIAKRRVTPVPPATSSARRIESGETQDRLQPQPQ